MSGFECAGKMCYNFKHFVEHNGICTNFRLILIEVIIDLRVYRAFEECLGIASNHLPRDTRFNTQLLVPATQVHN